MNRSRVILEHMLPVQSTAPVFVSSQQATSPSPYSAVEVQKHK